MNLKKSVISLFFIIVSINGSSQDSNVSKFDNIFTLKVLTKYNYMVYEDSLYDYELQTNRPLDIGVGIGYKDFTLDFSMSTPFLYDRNYSRSKSYDLGSLYFYEDKCYFDGYIKYYDGFINNDRNEVDITICNIGFSGEYIFNESHSIRSAYNLDRKQLESNGSFLLGGGIFLLSIKSNDDYLSEYSERKITYYFGPNIGYSYTLILKDNFFINALITFGVNCIVNKERISFGLQTLPKFSFGYHSKTWSINIYSNTSLLNNYLSESNSIVIAAETIGIVFSKRL